MAKRFWLVKQEPSAYSWRDFMREGRTAWTGVRNAQARNNLRGMVEGDAVLFYESGKQKSIVGFAKVVRPAYPDPTDPSGQWVCVDLEPLEPLPAPVTLADIKQNPRLAQIALLRQPRLSVVPLTELEFSEISSMASSNS